MSEAIREYLPWLLSAITISSMWLAGNRSPLAWKTAEALTSVLEPEGAAIVREAKAIALSLGEQESIAIDGINHVLTKHRDEWRVLVGAFPSGSLFRELGAMS